MPSITIAFTLQHQRERDAPLSQASTSYLPPNAQSGRQPQPWSSTNDILLHRNDQKRTSVYRDRVDPSGGARRPITTTCDRRARRRSNSPQSRDTWDPSNHRARHADPPSARGPSIPWKDLRMPPNDQRVSSSSTPTSENTQAKLVTPRAAPTAATKRMANDISKWNRKQAELHAAETPADGSAGSSLAEANATSQSTNVPFLPSNPTDTPTPAGSRSTIGATLSPKDVAHMSEAELASFDFQDQVRIACLLCQRKFKSLETLHRHGSESQLHKHNLANIDACRQGVMKKLESLENETSTHGDAVEENTATRQTRASTQPSTPALPVSLYRDRASERRAVFGADTPSKATKSSNNTLRVFDGPKPTTAAVALEEPLQSAPEKPIDSDNIGSQLLAMMGWSQGQGLGLNRAGRTDIVETKIYKPGAGLGSTIPTDTATHEARSNSLPTRTPAFTGYLDRAKDRKYRPTSTCPNWKLPD